MRKTTTRHSFPLMMTVAFSVAAAACAQVEAEVTDAQVTQKAVTFHGIPGGQKLGETSTSQSFTLTGDKLSWAKSLSSEVYLHEVQMEPVGNLHDLNFIHYARIIMSDGNGSSDIPTVELINYQRPDGAASTSDLAVETLQPVNVTKVWAAGKVVVTMQLAGVFPEENWAADVTLHLAGKMSYKL